MTDSARSCKGGGTPRLSRTNEPYVASGRQQAGWMLTCICGHYALARLSKGWVERLCLFDIEYCRSLDV